MICPFFYFCLWLLLSRICRIYETREKLDMVTIYEIGQVEIPTNEYNAHELIDGMLMMVALKNRVITFLVKFNKARAAGSR